MNAVDQENRWTLAALCERDPSVAPVKAALFATNQVGELVDTLSGKSVIGGGSAQDRAAGQKNFSPRSLESNRASGAAHGGSGNYCP